MDSHHKEVLYIEMAKNELDLAKALLQIKNIITGTWKPIRKPYNCQMR